MNRPKPQSPHLLWSIAAGSPARQQGGTLIGVVVGLLVGLVMAVVVAVFVMKSPGPFVEKVKRPGEVATEAGTLPDPNKGLTKGKAEAGTPEATGASGTDAGSEGASEGKGTSSPAGGGLAAGSGSTDAAAPSPGAASGLPGSGAPVGVATPMPPVPVLPSNPGSSGAGGGSSASSAGPSGPGVAPQSSAQPSGSTDAAPERATSYLLQIGAFRSQEDAESTKGRLALVGLEASIVRAEVNGTTFWRVRVGPFKDLDETNRARTRLAENGFDSSVIRSR
jgi:cell division protein FtsN